MNTFTELEEQSAAILAAHAEYYVKKYAQPEDREAATIALLLRALEIAGGKDFINHEEL